MIQVTGTRPSCKDLQDWILKDSRYVVCKSLSIEKEKVRLKDLMMAVCYDLSENYELVKVPRLLEAFLKQFWLAVDSSGKQVVLLVDRADELPKQTLPYLRKMFTLADSSRLTVVLLSESGRRNPV